MQSGCCASWRSAGRCPKISDVMLASGAWAVTLTDLVGPYSGRLADLLVRALPPGIPARHVERVRADRQRAARGRPGRRRATAAT